jgi:hypothetical protein
MLTGAGQIVGSLKWFAFLLFQRENRFSAILAGCALLQEFLVDAWVVVKRNRLQYIRFNQVKMKAAAYQKLVDSLENEHHIEEGRVILPSTFIGSPRSMSQLYQDAMALCRKYGHPSLFITMTANPNWPEITDNIPARDRA